MNRYVLIIITSLIVLLACVLVASKLIKKNNQPDVSTKQIETNKIAVDLNGDGTKEYVVYKIPNDPSNTYLDSMIAYDFSNKEIARLPEGITIKVPMSESTKIYKPEANNNKEIFSFEFITGPHQSNNMFFELQKDIIRPVCFIKEATGPYDCLFYSGNVGDLVVEDLDKNGLIDIVEIVDEYPQAGELSKEENDAIDNAFNEQGIAESTEEARQIALREKGGRERNVAWGIYSYNGDYFVPQTGKAYESIYQILKAGNTDIIRKSDLSKGSLEYIEFARNFWSHR